MPVKVVCQDASFVWQTQVVDATNLMANFGSLEMLREVRGPAAAGVDSGDERKVVDLLLDQIEFADTILLNVRNPSPFYTPSHAVQQELVMLAEPSSSSMTPFFLPLPDWSRNSSVVVPGLPQKTDLVPRRERARLNGLLRSLNPRAEVVQTVGSAVDLSHIINTHRFDMEAAQQGAGWLAVQTSVSPNQRFLCVLRIVFLPLDPLHYTHSQAGCAVHLKLSTGS